MKYLNKTRRRALQLLLRPIGSEEKAILAANETVRSELELRKEDGLAFRFRIPYRHMEALKHMIPQMQNHQPREDQKRAWDWFLTDELSKPYRVKA